MAAKKLKLGITKTNFPQYLRRFLEAKTMAKEATQRSNDQRDQIMAFVEKYGIEDEKGHMRVEAPGIGFAKRERKSSDVFDAEFAEEYLKKHKLWLKATETITVIDEDKLLALIYDGTIPEEVGDRMYTKKVSYAFIVEQEK
jgi:hypothetical protein